ncbi:MAG: alginate export family protein [Planctomycetes bacterium]|nr:alginate export family protein [Planctomycetota bacterium]
MRLLAAVALLLAPATALAQQDEETRRRQQEAEKLRDLEKREFFGEPSREFYLDYGAWLRPGWFSFRDGGGRDVSRFDFDVRLWGDVRYDVHQFYARLRTVYSHYANEDGPEGRDDVWDGPAGDVVFYQLLLGEWLGDPERWWDLSLRAGRQYERLGSGLVYNGVGDGLALRGRLGPVEFDLFGLRSVPQEDDLDASRPTADDQNRYFAGGTVSLRAIADHTPFLAVLVERDRADDGDEFQEYDFDAEYYGAGIHGQLFLDGLTYEVEGWIQRGSRFAFLQTGTPEDVRAYAFLASLEYVFDIPTHPRVRIGYMLGTGDPDRFRITNTALGNTAGTDDEAFLGFGYIPTGYSLAPLLSNLRIFRAGASWRPLEDVELWELQFDQLEVGLDFYHYRKDHAGGGISDPYAGFDDGRIGYEVDFYLHWGVLSDLSVSARMGFFFPGAAYEDDGVRPFYSFSAVFSF